LFEQAEPVAVGVELATGDEEDRLVFEGHGVGGAGVADDLDVVDEVEKVFPGGAFDDDEGVAVITVRSPEKVVVLTGESGWEPVAEEVEGAGFAVVFADDAGNLPLLGRERVEDVLDLVSELVVMWSRPVAWVYASHCAGGISGSESGRMKIAPTIKVVA
jgi:hypothetical protein